MKNLKDKTFHNNNFVILYLWIFEHVENKGLSKVHIVKDKTNTQLEKKKEKT
jgi:hypothetical protein